MRAGALKRLVMVGSLAGIAWAFSGPAGASGDYSCGPTWTLNSPDLDCGSNLVISPGTDTRVNLALLLRDRGGLASKAGGYPELEYDYSFARNFVDWSIFSRAAYPEYGFEENDYYGSRCVSLKGGDAAFNAAVVANSKLKPADREALVAARGQLAPICGQFGGGYYVQENEQPKNPQPSAWPLHLTSKPAQDFVTYLVAAAAFYGEDWNAARDGFTALAASSDPWLKETARYMQARTDLNAAQSTSFDEWGSFELEKTDRVAANRAGQGFADYLKAWPKGHYAASAKGLQRRVMWISGDLGPLSDMYEAMLLASAPGSTAEQNLIQEIDYKLLPEDGAAKAIDTPYLLATYDLMRMRARGDGDYSEYGPQPIDEGELAAQEPLFKGHEELYQFIRANYRFYVAGDAQDVLLRIPDNSVTRTHSALDFSRQILRGQALAAMKDPGEEAFWRRLIGGSTGIYQRPAAELGLALHWERAGKIPLIFAADSPVQDSMIRKILIEKVASPDILRAEVKDNARPKTERDLALFTLLYKQLSHGYFTAFTNDVKLVPAGADIESGLWNLTSEQGVPVGLFTTGKFTDAYSCPALSATAAALAKNAKDVKGRLCLGEFYRLNGFDDFYEFDPPELGNYGEPLPKGTLGSGKSLFPGSPTPRQAIYTAIMADPAAAPADKAYAYYRAVRCYAPSGNNTCGGDEVDENQRKAWFNTLKRQYAATKWAKELEFYW